MRNIQTPVKIAEEYASQYFDKEKETDKWLIIRNAWLDGWNKHRLVYPEMQQNMRQEDKELLLKDLSSRLPYGVKCWASYNKFPTTLVDVNADTVGDNLFIVTVKLKKTGLNSPSLIEDIKPYLRPMSSMTEEEQRTLDSMCNGVEMASRLSGLKMFDKAFNWLNENHFDYRGLIEKGLAIDATGLNVY